ncbi:fas-activated serine/threonine kinase [Tachyglossus aculeatus]|uniref:fas-activated serine/threonine kinase n=1 Tax=Tachyglossus aculeatus TaxID=9261 RepID=UPI0018F60617|nr:fas-activated serine/threonine kinase [Tachyglossus aculeatus]
MEPNLRRRGGRTRVLTSAPPLACSSTGRREAAWARATVAGAAARGLLGRWRTPPAPNGSLAAAAAAAAAASSSSSSSSRVPSAMLRALLRARHAPAGLPVPLPPGARPCHGAAGERGEAGEHRAAGERGAAGSDWTPRRLPERAGGPGEPPCRPGQSPAEAGAWHHPVVPRQLGRPPVAERRPMRDLSRLVARRHRRRPSFDTSAVRACLPVDASLGFPEDRAPVQALEQEPGRRISREQPAPGTQGPAALPAGHRGLEAALSWRRFLRYPPQQLLRSIAEVGPEGLTPHGMVLLAQHLARHRLREPRLLDAIAHFLVAQAAQLDGKVVQKLLLPFGRLNYLPRHELFVPCLERLLAREAGAAPLATVNILMSLCQLRCLPLPTLHLVFSPTFIRNVIGSPHALIMHRYLSLLDTAVQLELPGYQGPRLPPRHRVPIFPQPLTADHARCKYSHKWWVAEGLRQLLGKDNYRQDLVVPPGYCTGPGPSSAPPAGTSRCPTPPPPPPKTKESVLRVALTVQERWHFCRDGTVLLGSRALRERHLQLLGYQLVPLPYPELEAVRGLPQLKRYLSRKLHAAVGLRQGPAGG